MKGSFKRRFDYVVRRNNLCSLAAMFYLTLLLCAITVAASARTTDGISLQTGATEYPLTLKASHEGPPRPVGTRTSPDRRWKKDIVPLKFSLDKIMKLQGVSYYWRRKQFPEKHFIKGKQIGLIAQDVRKVVPEVVTEDKQGFFGIAYDKLVPVLIEAVKELKELFNGDHKILLTLLNSVKNNFSDIERLKVAAYSQHIEIIRLKAVSATQAVEIKQLKAANDNQAAALGKLERQISDMRDRTDRIENVSPQRSAGQRGKP